MTEHEENSYEKARGATGHPAAQIPLSRDLVEQLGESAEDYANELWSVAQQRDLDAEQMAASIRGLNQRFGVAYPDTVVDRLQEIFRNSGGFVTIISDERVLAGAISDVDAFEPPHVANTADGATDTAG